MVASTGTVGVEALRFDAAIGQVLAGGAGGLERASRGDVVGGHGVAEQCEHTGAVDVLDRIGVAFMPSKKVCLRT